LWGIEPRGLVGHDETVPLTLAELRVGYVGVLGRPGGMVIAMLDQLANRASQPGRSEHRASLSPGGSWH
jgi:hypothetical protein